MRLLHNKDIMATKVTCIHIPPTVNNLMKKAHLENT